MQTEIITEDEWLDKYSPEETLYETYGEDYQKIKDLPDNLVWTLVDTDNDYPSIISGRRFVNRIGYYIGRNPHNTNDLVVVQVQ